MNVTQHTLSKYTRHPIPEHPRMDAELGQGADLIKHRTAHENCVGSVSSCVYPPTVAHSLRFFNKHLTRCARSRTIS